MYIPLAPLFGALCAWFPPSYAALVQPADGPYRAERTSDALYVFDEAARAEYEDLRQWSEALTPVFERTFAWRLDEEKDVILASSNQQYANAFAAVAPNLKTFWWPSGAGDTDDFAVPSWGRLIATHETTHLYQLNAKGVWNARLKRVFGNSWSASPLIWPIFIHPNQLVPTSLLEGNAVLNESRVASGGRLYSGEIRATVLRLIAAREVDPSRLINVQFKFPFGEAPYDLGAYFMAHLTGKYGIDLVNGFFRAQGDHWLNPLILNRTFRAHFGSSFYQEVREFTRGLEPAAAAQRISAGEVVAEHPKISALNHDDASVWWLGNPGYRVPDLYVFEKRTGAVTRRAIDLLEGKVFFAGGRPLTAAQNQQDLHHLRFGLYAEHAYLAPGTAGEIVTDRRGGHRVSLDAGRSWLAGRVLKDGAPFDVTNSNPILDRDGHVYHFRQLGNERLLYRDHELITRLPGYYAKLTEVDQRGGVLFVGATPYGASLFRYAAGAITREVASDVVLDARLIDADRVLVKEVTARGYRVVVTERTPRPEEPATYVYPFPSEAPRPDGGASAKSGPYGGWRELRFSAMNFGVGYASSVGTLGGLTASFRDPLEYHALDLDFGYSVAGPRRALVEYDYSRWLTRPLLRYAYREDEWWYDGSTGRYADQEANLGIKLPWLRRGRWDAGLEAELVYARYGADDPFARSHDALGGYGRVGARRLIPSPLGLYPWRNVEAAAAGRVLEDERGLSFEAAWDHGFTNEYYLNVAAQVAAANGRTLTVGYNPYPLGTRLVVPRLSGDDFKTSRAARARLEARKVFTLPRYDTRVPVGLNRVALVVAGQAMALPNAEGLFEAAAGVDADLLFAHKMRVTSRLLGGVANEVSREPGPFVMIRFSSRGF